jgi:branched-chain amino acid aminotransferase
MDRFINYNGNIISSDEKIITANNRGFKYGDGVFETIRVANENIPLAAFHFERLFESLKLLQFTVPAGFSAENLIARIIELCKKNNRQKSARVRLMVFREDGLISDTSNNIPQFIIQTDDIPHSALQWNQEGFITKIFPGGRKTCDLFSNLKSNNFLLYSMAMRYAHENNLNETIILNFHENICEGSVANIFFIRNKTIFTPALVEGCVAGTMRKYLLQKLAASGYKISEQKCTINNLEAAEEIFFTNAINGIRWVKYVGDKEYKNEQTRKLYDSFIKNLF